MFVVVVVVFRGRGGANICLKDQGDVYQAHLELNGEIMYFVNFFISC